MKLSKLSPAKGATHKIKRVGRGNASGQGTTAGRGNKGAGARTGSKRKARFEGGQMPLYRRLPKVGFTNIFRKEFIGINVETLNQFSKDKIVDPPTLHASGIVKKLKSKIKILGDGELKHALNVKAHAFSKSAKKKIESAGGKVEVL